MGMTVEIVETDWFDQDAIRLPNYKVGRVNFEKGRSYIKIEDDGQLAQPFRLYTSLTTSIAQSMPTPVALEDWKMQHGKKEADRLMKVAAHYGTMMHLEIGKFIKEGVYDLDLCEDVVQDYTSSENFWDNDCNAWGTKLKEDMLAFVQFYNDYEVEPLGLEYVLLSDKRGFGTPIDLVCYLTVTEDGLDHDNPYKSGPRKGEPRDVKVRVKKRAIINFKSGRKGFYETHGIQMECEKLLWDENFPDTPVEIAMNWAPADWRVAPAYKIREWQGTTSLEEIEAILKLAEIRYSQRAGNKTYMSMSGMISTLESINAAVQFEDVEAFCNRKFGNTPVPPPKNKATKALQAIPLSFKSTALPI